MPSSYTTIQGDTFDLVAFKTLGSEYYMAELIEANPAHRETVVFPADVTLVIPDITMPVTENLPPWKR